ncbi:HET-domain-containing protein [Cadophora sp. DSE1049]|nr:HET-domain-containing protein [Cadophora sp. DSE1049]
MGNIIGHLVDVTDNWPPNHANKKHWCYEAGSNPDHDKHYCDDPNIGSPQYDTDFDYSVFRCREARCQTCLDLNPELYPARGLWSGTNGKKADPQSREIHVTSKSLLESTSGGCKICSVLKEGIGLVGGSKALVPNNVFSVELLKGFTVRVTHETPMKSATEEEERLAIELHSSFDEVTPLAWKAFGAAERVTREVEVTDCVKFINSSIKKCLEHPKCVQNHCSCSRSKLPTRLIDVGAGENDVRLETSLKAVERYIALSHAWGTLHLPRTTTTNLRQHCENIPWASLSRTFQDAISITRGLGIRYIWIDSLCIIQDSLSDWEAEAKDMKNVYENSYLTLAATSAAESSEGLLRPRYNLNENNNPEYVCEYEIKRSDRLSQHSIYARQAIKYSHKFLLSLEYKGGHKELAPLLYRAWVLQERILSPRTLHFSFDEMVWECKTGIDCECGFAASPSGRTVSVSPLGLHIFKELFNNSQASNLQIPDKTRKADYEKELFSAWYRLVEYYMALSLTFPADRLPALRGMTRSLEEKLGWTFLEGVWVEDVVPGLLWSRNWLRSFRRNQTAPSWSWASIELLDSSS